MKAVRKKRMLQRRREAAHRPEGAGAFLLLAKKA
jgi:hypothetical protein